MKKKLKFKVSLNHIDLIKLTGNRYNEAQEKLDRYIITCKPVYIKKCMDRCKCNDTFRSNDRKNAVVGAGIVVTKDFPDNAVFGNPARVIRYLDADKFVN